MIFLPTFTPFASLETVEKSVALHEHLANKVSVNDMLGWLVEGTFAVTSIGQIYEFLKPVQTNRDVPRVIYKNNNATWTDPHTGTVYWAQNGQWTSEDGTHPIEDREQWMDGEKAFVMGPNATDSGMGMLGGLF